MRRIEIKVDYGKTLPVFIVVILAAAANAWADTVMLEMGIKIGGLLDILEWSWLQWKWHLLKWFFFNFTIGLLGHWLIGLKRVVVLGAVCLLIWEVVYQWAQS